MPSGRLVIRNFAQISEARIQFRDLTVLVGAQGTGKSLVLQWLKAAIDGKYIVKTLREAGQEVSRKTLIDLIFGVGMSAAWRDSTSQVSFDSKDISPATIEKRGMESRNCSSSPHTARCSSATVGQPRFNG